MCVHKKILKWYIGEWNVIYERTLQHMYIICNYYEFPKQKNMKLQAVYEKENSSVSENDRMLEQYTIWSKVLEQIEYSSINISSYVYFNF